MPLDPPQTRRFYVGLDLGQRRDYTALVVLEKIVTPLWGDQWLYARRGETSTTRLLVRMIEKIRLATPYPEIVDWVREIISHHELQKRVTLTVDATGVGAPVVDLLRRANLGSCNLVPITITGSAAGNYNPVTGTVPRSQLLTNLQLQIQENKIEIANGCAHVEALKKELRHVKLDGTINGCHDDLTIALALAVWSCGKGH